MHNEGGGLQNIFTCLKVSCEKCSMHSSVGGMKTFTITDHFNLPSFGHNCWQLPYYTLEMVSLETYVFFHCQAILKSSSHKDDYHAFWIKVWGIFLHYTGIAKTMVWDSFIGNLAQGIMFLEKAWARYILPKNYTCHCVSNDCPLTILRNNKLSEI